MQINLIAIGTKMPAWVSEGYNTYAKRMPLECRLNLIEIEMPKRQKNADIDKLKHQECKLLLNKVKANDMLIALDAQGQQTTTENLAFWLQVWQTQGCNINLLIGGPDGLHQDCPNQAKRIWSLAKLTLPHPLVRIVVAEQLYRAWSINSHHPYHR